MARRGQAHRGDARPSENDKTTDSSELLSTENPRLDIAFVAAGDADGVIRVFSGGRTARIDSAKKADSRFWMVVTGLNRSFNDFISTAVVLDPEITRESAEGYANFLKRLGMLIETMKKAVAGPIKDQLAKWDSEDQGESLQEADNPLDVRLYEIDYVMSYPLGQGFEITDIHNIIRAIPDVTTVRTIGNAKRDHKAIAQFHSSASNLPSKDRRIAQSGSSRFSYHRFTRLAVRFGFTK